MKHKARLDNKVSNKFGSPSFLILYYGFANPYINNSTIKEALVQMAIAATDISSSHPIKVASSSFISISKIAYRSENIKEFRHLLATKGWLPVDLEAEERARKEKEERKRKAEEEARKAQEERRRKAEEEARKEIIRQQKQREEAERLIEEAQRQIKRAKTERINNILYNFILLPLGILVAAAALFGLYKGGRATYSWGYGIYERGVNYDQAISEGDKSFHELDYAKALESYKKALDFKKSKKKQAFANEKITQTQHKISDEITILTSKIETVIQANKISIKYGIINYDDTKLMINRILSLDPQNPQALKSLKLLEIQKTKVN
ncbi:MAG: hypothetical protein RR285_05715 [Acinetobacter sp.]